MEKDIKVAPKDFSHPRTLGWFGTACIAMGGSNQNLFLLNGLFGGQEANYNH